MLIRSAFFTVREEKRPFVKFFWMNSLGQDRLHRICCPNRYSNVQGYFPRQQIISFDGPCRDGYPNLIYACDEKSTHYKYPGQPGYFYLQLTVKKILLRRLVQQDYGISYLPNNFGYSWYYCHRYSRYLPGAEHRA